MSISTILIAVFIVLSVIILVSAYFSKIPRKIGFRNVKRRIGNTILVIIGSMVGTALISGSLVLGDSLDKTFVKLVENQIGEIDVYMTFKEVKPSLFGTAVINQEETNQIKEVLKDEQIDGVLPLLFFWASPQKIDQNGDTIINAYQIQLTGYDFNDLKTFGEEPQALDKVKSENGIVVSKDMAGLLELGIGDKVRAQIFNKPLIFQVEKIVENKGIFGGNTIVADANFIWKELGIPSGTYNYVYVSAKGGTVPKDYNGEQFKKDVDSLLENFKSENVKPITTEQKQTALDGFGAGFLADIFLVLSLFGIFSGILLIVNLYSMLASERKSEMGILRAIALTRFKLAQTFVFEGYFYSVIAAFVGSFVGLGLGYGLVFILSNLIKQIFDQQGGGNGFGLSFDVQPSSMIIAFAAGALITIITTLFTSFRISKLNIVSAIRDTEEYKESKINFKWVVSTILMLLVLCNAVSTLGFSFIAKDFLQQSREQAVEQNMENNPFTTMTDKQFDAMVNQVTAYSLYMGVVFTVLVLSFLLIRFAKLFKKDISRPVITISGIVLIAFNYFMVEIDAVSKALNEESGVALFFMSGIILVLSLSLIVTYNLNLIVSFINIFTKPFRKQKPVFLTAFRYPAENVGRTGLTLVMFAVIIFLIGYISINKAIANQQTGDLFRKALGGYEVIIFPDQFNASDDIKKISEAADKVDGIKDVTSITNTAVIMPDFKYKDLPDQPYYGDPSMLPIYEDEDYFQTTIDALPADFIKNQNIELEEFSSDYKNKEEVWNTVINDPSKVVLGSGFVVQGYGKRPSIKVGDKIKIADSFNNTVTEKEVIGLVKPAIQGFVNFDFYSNIITTSDNLDMIFDSNYIDTYSNFSILTKIEDGKDGKLVSKDLRKATADYSIIYIVSVDDILGVTQIFINNIIAMLQGFLAFSLIVGTSGLAIIMVRSVNERKQQIGMLRSLGFQRNMVLLSFFIEATFITVLAIIIGLSMGILGAYTAVKVSQDNAEQITLVIPWIEIFVISFLVYIASILFSLLPSIKASRLSPVEATNYPE